MISVCMPTYNGEKFIQEQIGSIIKQLGPGDELIVSDDGSTDRTLSIVSAFQDQRIKIIHHVRNVEQQKYKFMYATMNVENALSHAEGDYIFLADQDDIWLEGKVLHLLEQLKVYDLVTSNCTVIDEEGNLLHESYFNIIGSGPGLLRNLKVNAYLGCCMAFRKALLIRVLPISTHQVPHDIWIGLLAEIYGKVGFITTPLVAYRRHQHNLSPSGGVSRNSLYFKVSYRMMLIYSLIRRVSKIK